VILAALGAASLSAAAGEDRTISFYHIHTQETLTVTYKKDGKFVPEALEKINWIMRDWRKNKAIAIDPNTIDIIWEMHEELGSREPVHIICGYRSRETNEMLRRTVGGQASQSQHITGKAVDLTFPDVPLRRLRYSAMIRERGGVGYYPTSGIPFVHVDTSNVRHWPRMPRNELALLFPAGHSKYEPSDGRPITPADVQRARAGNKDLVQEVAAFYALRDAPKAPVQVAEANIEVPLPIPPQPTPAARPVSFKERMGVGAPLPPPEVTTPEAMPSLVASASRDAVPVVMPALVSTPKLVDRPSKFVAKLPDADRARLDKLVALAALDERSVAPAAQPAALITGSTPQPARTMTLKASMTPEWPLGKSKPLTAAPPTEAAMPAPHPLGSETADWRSGWASAPEFDEDHPDDLAYAPFPLGPFLTETESFDDPALAVLVHPDASKTLEVLDDEGSAPPLSYGAGDLKTAMTWAQEFSGEAINIGAMQAPAREAAPPQLFARAVKTEQR
jgi:uncharacterized protein YcbK (DUF882 family)